ncbi:hypothetical protein [Massilia sp.]|uniref:hypothetical protein n=1 Tax=Massilia sp. TaxID=1882437 RepID=UPI00289C670C|nr:hypothetical protein [Massilia sp.]
MTTGSDLDMLSTEESENDLIAMVEEIGTAVAAGLVPVVGQAINVYDTIECLLALHNSKGVEAENEAKFDLVLAIVGWIPGAGGGVKKTIRIVNKNPARYAPILFDVLRMVCLKLSIRTSPEVLLEKLFDAAGLIAVLGAVQSSVEKSWAYEQLPVAGQQVLSSTLGTVRSSLPAMVTLVTMKLTKWRRVQRDTASRSIGSRKTDPASIKPAAIDPQTAKMGHNAPHQVPSNTSANAVVGTSALAELTNDVIGILGEHITDYFLYEEFGWGKGWNAHDKGTSGEWEYMPGKQFPGKLNEATKLNPLVALKAHGVGIDGVWKVQLADPHNGNKPYAIVESKASSNAVTPRIASRKPQVAGKLLSNARRLRQATAVATALPKTVDLLDPPTADAAASAGAPAGGGLPGGQSARARRGQQARQRSNGNSSAGSSTKSSPGETPIVQMSRRWISKNIAAAVKDMQIGFEFRDRGHRIYSRHLFYTPFYLPAAAEHALALKSAESSAAVLHTSHQNHAIPSTHRHDEKEVKEAVNAKLKALKRAQEI